MSKTKEVVVVGGGIAGLACGTKLAEAGLDIVVLEKDRTPGGNVRTEEVSGYRIERGPHTVLASAEALFSLADHVGLRGALTSPRKEAKARFIARDGKLHEVPSGPWSFLTTSLLSLGGKVRLATEPFRAKGGTDADTAAQFFERRFGKEAAQVLAGAFISGVYAGDPEALSAPSAFPLFWRFEQEAGSMIRGAMSHQKERKHKAKKMGQKPLSGLYSFAQGLGQLTGTLAQRLGPSCVNKAEVKAAEKMKGGFRVHTDSHTYECEKLVLATPPQATSPLLESVNSDLGALLQSFPMAPVAAVSLGFAERAQAIPEGYGFLAPRGQKVRTLGVLFPSRLFDGRAQKGGDLLTGFVGGVQDRAAMDLPDEQIEQIVRKDLETLTGLKDPPAFVRVRKHPQAIPQLVVGHKKNLEQIGEALEKTPGLVLAGNYLKGVGIKDAAQSGVDAASLISTS